MTVPNVLDHLEDGTVLIVPGDRPDVIVTAVMTRSSSAYPSVAGVVLSGGLRPDPRVVALIDTLSGGASMPLLAVEDRHVRHDDRRARRRGGHHRWRSPQDRHRARTLRGPRRPRRTRTPDRDRPLRGDDAGDVPVRADRAGAGRPGTHRASRRLRRPDPAGRRPDPASPGVRAHPAGPTRRGPHTDRRARAWPSTTSTSSTR